MAEINRKRYMKTEKEMLAAQQEQVECQDIKDGPVILEEIVIEELGIDGICGVY